MHFKSSRIDKRPFTGCAVTSPVYYCTPQRPVYQIGSIYFACFPLFHPPCASPLAFSANRSLHRTLLWCSRSPYLLLRLLVSHNALEVKFIIVYRLTVGQKSPLSNGNNLRRNPPLRDHSRQYASKGARRVPTVIRMTTFRHTCP